MADEGTKVAAYVPWRTFKNSLDRFSQGLPNRIDKTVFKGQSGSIQTQLQAALKFLGLIGDDLVPTATMKSLVAKDELERKGDLVQIFKTCYSKLFDLDLSKATPQQLDQEMANSYGVSGSTLRKASRFFLVGASDIGIPLSSFLVVAKGTTNGAARRRPVRRQRVPVPGAQEDHQDRAAPQVGGTSKSIQLRHGEVVTLSATADFFAMEEEDQQFLFSILKQLKDYERKSQTEAPSGQGQTDEGAE